MEERARKKKIELEEEVDYSDMTPEQIRADKLRRQKLQEEADLELAKETLGYYHCCLVKFEVEICYDLFWICIPRYNRRR